MTMSRTSVVASILLVSVGGALVAQEGDHMMRRRVVVHEAGGAGDHTIAFAPQAATYEFIGAAPGLEGKVVKGVPYSADGVTETSRTLADGTKIVRRSESKIYRDSEGRTRREHTLGTIGHWTSSGEPPKTIVINDPVAGEILLLNPQRKEAKKISVTTNVDSDVTGDATAGVDVHLGHAGERMAKAVWIERHKIHAAGEHVTEHDFTSVAGQRGPMVAKTTKEADLGERNIEGVIAQGKRTTTTIPEGQIGNDREISIVTERWFSPELQAVVLNTSDDPLSGKVTYRLTNIQRGNPPASVFQAPADYTVSEGSALHRQITIKRSKP